MISSICWWLNPSKFRENPIKLLWSYWFAYYPHDTQWYSHYLLMVQSHSFPIMTHWSMSNAWVLCPHSSAAPASRCGAHRPGSPGRCPWGTSAETCPNAWGNATKAGKHMGKITQHIICGYIYICGCVYYTGPCLWSQFPAKKVLFWELLDCAFAATRCAAMHKASDKHQWWPWMGGGC